MKSARVKNLKNLFLQIVFIVCVLIQGVFNNVFCAPAPAAQPLKKTAAQRSTTTASQQKTSPPSAVIAGDGMNAIMIKIKLISYKGLFAKFGTHTTVEEFTKIISDFLREIVYVVGNQDDITVEAIEETKVVIDSLLANLITINNRLSSVPSSDRTRTVVSDFIKQLKKQSSAIGKKLETQKAFLSLVENARNIPNEKFQDKINQYRDVVKQINEKIVSGARQDLIRDFESMANYAKTKGDTEKEQLSQLINEVQNNPYFNATQRQQVANVFSDRPVVFEKSLTLAVITEAAAKGDIIFQTKLKELLAIKTIPERIAAAKSLLVLITAASVQIDKNNMMTVLNDLFMSQATMKKEELVALRELLDEALKNQFLLAPNQRGVMQQWLKTMTTAVELADERETLITSLKNKIDKDKENYSLALKSALYALNLLDTKLPKDELDKRKQKSLVFELRRKIPSYYNNRAGKSIDDLKMLRSFMDLSKSKTSLSDVVGKDWTRVIGLTIQLIENQSQTNVLSKLVTLGDIAKKIKPSTDAYEKRMFVDQLTTLFANRKDRATKEIEEFDKLLTYLTTPIIQKNKIFESSVFKMFEEWKKVLDGTVVLLQSQLTQNIQQLIGSLTKILPNITGAKTEYEKDLFVKIISNIFANRGDLNNGELVEVKKFFEQTKSTQNLLMSNQLAVLDIWIKEINWALGIVKDTKSYLQALIDDATVTKDITKFSKALDLFVKQPSTEVKNAFVSGLNNLFIERKALDAIALKDLFIKVDQKVIDRVSLLSDVQRSVLKQWISTIEKEIKPA